MHQPDPRHIHAAEQGAAAIRDVAQMIATFYTTLLAADISPEHALAITLQYQRLVLTGGTAMDA
jgi:hypothetical protein